MSLHQQLNDTTVKTNSKILWLGMQANAPIIMAIVLFINKLLQLEPISPDLKNILIGLCVISIPMPLFILNYFKRKQREIRDNMQLGMDNSPKDLQRYFSLLVIGMSICSLPAMFGLILFILAKELPVAIFFICVSFFLGFLFKPVLK